MTRKEFDKRRRAKHKSAHLRYMGHSVEIDTKIIPLVRATWRLGLRTEFSCQYQPPGHLYYRKYDGRWVFLKMPARDAARWLNIAWVDRPNGLDWRFEAWPGKSGWGIFIYFRWEILSDVLKRLRAAERLRKMTT